MDTYEVRYNDGFMGAVETVEAENWVYDPEWVRFEDEQGSAVFLIGSRFVLNIRRVGVSEDVAVT